MADSAKKEFKVPVKSSDGTRFRVSNGFSGSDHKMENLRLAINRTNKLKSRLRLAK